MKGIRRETCSYKGSIPIVCCEIEKQKQIQPQHPPQKLKTKRPVGQISKESKYNHTVCFILQIFTKTVMFQNAKSMANQYMKW